MKRERKYTAPLLLKELRIAADVRNKLLVLGFTDNGGAIYSAERIVNMLGMALVYPDVDHMNNLRKWQGATFSVEAQRAFGAAKGS
jgi:hypothetical protein